jgi:hypothetical protein
MSGVFRNIDPPTPSPPAECVPPRCGGEDTLAGWGGGGGAIVSVVLEDARHCFVLYLCKWCSVDGKITSCNDAAECGKMVWFGNYAYFSSSRQGWGEGEGREEIN